MDFQFVSNAQSRKLVVVANSLPINGSVENDSKYDFYKTFEDSGNNVLFIKDVSQMWYINHVESIVKLIKSILKGIDEITFVGHSAGGFICLILPYYFPEHAKNCIVFSPQTDITKTYNELCTLKYGKPEDMSLFVNHENIDDGNENFQTCYYYLTEYCNYDIYFCKHNNWDNHFANQVSNKVTLHPQSCDHHACAYFCKVHEKFGDIFSYLLP